MNGKIRDAWLDRISTMLSSEDVVDLAQRAQVKWLTDPMSVTTMESSAIVVCIRAGETRWMADKVLVHFSRA
jgi:hypothetical protein